MFDLKGPNAISQLLLWFLVIRQMAGYKHDLFNPLSINHYFRKKKKIACVQLETCFHSVSIEYKYMDEATFFPAKTNLKNFINSLQERFQSTQQSNRPGLCSHLRFYL